MTCLKDTKTGRCSGVVIKRIAGADVRLKTHPYWGDAEVIGIRLGVRVPHVSTLTGYDLLKGFKNGVAARES